MTVRSFVVSFLFVCGAAQATDTSDVPESSAQRMSADSLRDSLAEADAFARALKLPVLKDGGPDEVRAWVGWATFVPDTNGIATDGYVVSSRPSQKCEVEYSGKSTEPTGGKCRHYWPPAGHVVVMRDLLPLTQIANTSRDCGIMDGDWVLIDAVSKGQRFVAYAATPDSCSDEGARLIARFLNKIRK